MLGCAPAQVLFEQVVTVKKNEERMKSDGVSAPRCFRHYDVAVASDLVPAGVELLELPRDMEKL